MNKIAYISMQATRNGYASYAHVHEIICGLEKRGWEIELFTPRYSVETMQPPGAFGRFLSFYNLNKKIIQNLKHFNLIYIRSHFAAFPISLCAHLMNIKVIQEVNGLPEDLFIAWPWTRRFSKLFRWLSLKQYIWSDACITVTPKLKEWLESIVKNGKVYFIPNAANTILFNPQAQTNRSLPKKYVVFFGAMAEWQGIDTILEAIKSDLWPSDLHFVAMGDGPKRQLIEELQKTEPKIQYLGIIPYSEVPGIITGSLAGLSPQNNHSGRSDSGLYPLKVFETLACGVPVIVTDFPGQADLIREFKCGIVINHDNSQELITAILRIYDDPEEAKKMGIRGRAAVDKEYSWDNAAEVTNKIIKDILINTSTNNGSS